MSRSVCVSLLATMVLVCFAGALPGMVPARGGGPVDPVEGETPPLDVNDVSFLWPVPQTPEQCDSLISAEMEVVGGSSSIWPEAMFAKALEVALSDDAMVRGSNGDRRIGIPPEFRSRATWKVAGIRIDPGSPGSHSDMISVFGRAPQIRLILQPVTVDGGQVQVHDYAAHLAYTFITGLEPGADGGRPRFLPDDETFRAIVDDLVALKGALKAAGVDTEGTPLSVHPGLANAGTAAEFSAGIEAILAKYLHPQRLLGVAFMGIPRPGQEPWIFFLLQQNQAGEIVQRPIGSVGGSMAQMFTKLDAPQIVPEPTPTNLNALGLDSGPSGRLGVSTAIFFGAPIDTDDPAPIGRAEDGTLILAEGESAMRIRDIPDLIANPDRANIMNTDCVSCHTESRIRKTLELPASPHRYALPAGMSGVDEDLLPDEEWNVHNFGWFPSPFGPPTKATIVQRTANEAAESADFINRVFLDHAP